MLTVTFAECHIQATYAECRFVECHFYECRYAVCHGVIAWLRQVQPHPAGSAITNGREPRSCLG